jgi:hypothetical protein
MNMDNSMQKHSIEFNRDQYFILMKAVYLGNWMVNAHRTDDTKEEYEAIEEKIFSFAPKFGLDKFVDHENTDHYYPTRYFEEETDVHDLHDEYDEETVWDELANWLGERDFFARYSKAEVMAMSREEFFAKKSKFVDVYEEEFHKHGLDRIRIEKGKID